MVMMIMIKVMTAMELMLLMMMLIVVIILMSSEMFIDTEVCYLIDNSSLLFLLTVIARVIYSSLFCN